MKFYEIRIHSNAWIIWIINRPTFWFPSAWVSKYSLTNKFFLQAVWPNSHCFFYNLYIKDKTEIFWETRNIKIYSSSCQFKINLKIFILWIFLYGFQSSIESLYVCPKSPKSKMKVLKSVLFLTVVKSRKNGRKPIKWQYARTWVDNKPNETGESGGCIATCSLMLIQSISFILV
jgi:hypothetical protein